MYDREKTIDDFACWIDNEENGVCHIPLNLCKEVLELLKEQKAKEQKEREKHPCERCQEWNCEGCPFSDD